MSLHVPQNSRVQFLLEQPVQSFLSDFVPVLLQLGLLHFRGLLGGVEAVSGAAAGS